MKPLAFFIGLALLFTGCSTKKSVEFDFSPPLKDVVVEADELTIDPTQGQLVHFENGTSIDVPENAFTDAAGNVVTEPITLALTTFDSPAEILASGIPMAYNDGERNQDFESAGMFQIKGSAAGKEVFIQEGKELSVNYPSATAGDYDFFYLEENEEEGAKKASWKKLNSPGEPETESEPIPTGLGDYQLQFDTASYPELAELESIQWRVASEHGNPLDEENAWVLDKKWASVELSQPKYGLGKVLFTDSILKMRGYHSPIFAKNKTRIIFTGKKSTNFWDSTGRLIRHIEHAEKFGRTSLIAEKYLLVHFEDGEGIYDFDGKLLCKLEEGYGHVIIPSEQRVIFTKRGEFDTTLIYDLDGNKVNELVQGQRTNRGSSERSVVFNCLITRGNEIITNSEKGIVIHNLNGAERQLKEGKHYSFKYLSPQTLLIEEMDGRLTVWNWKTGEQVSSDLSDFSVLSEIKSNTRYMAYTETLPEAHSVIITEAFADNDILWNYETGRVSELRGRLFSYHTDSHEVSQLWTKDRQNSTHVLYNVSEQEVVMQGPSIRVSDEIHSLDISYSKDFAHFLLSTTDHSSLYRSDGSLIKNFKDFDSSIIHAYFTGQQLVKSISSKGLLTTWDLQGNRIRSKQLGYSNFDHVFSDNFVIRNSVLENGFVTYGNKMSGLNHFDALGQLRMTANYLYHILDSNSILTYDQTGIQLNRPFELPAQAYQLKLATGSETFNTYVFLSQEDQEKLDRYNTIRTQRLNVEKDRQKKEAAVVRSFAIKNFGIYNWDRFYKDESRVRIAASFDFGVPTDFNSITVFLITEVNGTSVIKFYDGSWEKFSIDPKVNNQLLAVLPENKVAHLSNKNLQKLDWAAIQKNGNHSFQMNVSQEPIANLLQLAEVIN